MTRQEPEVSLPPRNLASQTAVPRRRAAPLAAWLMLTAVVAALFAVIANSLNWNAQELPSVIAGLISLAAGAVVGFVLGGIAGLFDSSPLRGGILGGIAGGLTGAAAIAALTIPVNRIDIACHVSAIAGICILVSAIAGRWSR